MKSIFYVLHSFFLIAVCLGVTLFTPQMAHAEVLFPDETGNPLIGHLAEEFQPEGSFSYRRARDFMYSDLDNHQGIISGIYTNFEIQVDPNSSTPRRDTFEQGINAEHVWPRSKGARQGRANSDLHHLFPSKVNVNGARGSNAFGEIPDPQTRDWYRADQQQSQIPDQDIDDYSESTSGRFEPREDRKGDVARAMFYFYTIYQNQADDPFFEEQRQTLCDWQAQDPISDTEVERSHGIANSRQGNENPFILDDSLAQRAYCS